MGDINARTGQLNDYIVNDNNDYLPVPDSMTVDKHYKRNNMDNHINNFGKALVKLCSNTNCLILNGRVAGDSLGKFTSHQYGGSSLVDYGVISHSLLHNVQYFKVWPLSHLSDHCPISLSLSVNFKHVGINNIDNINPLPGKFIWDENSGVSFIEAINSKSIKKKIDDFHSNNFEDVNKAVNDFNDILTDAARCSLKFVHPRIKRKINKPKNKRWFEKDVSVLRKELIKWSHLLDKFPNDNSIRHERYKINKKYKRLIKVKKREFRAKLCDKIISLQHSDPKQFWKLLEQLGNLETNSSKHDNINSETWLNHFKALNNNCVTSENSFTKNIIGSIDDMENNNINNPNLGFDFTNKEIMHHIKLLKSGKASGNDIILNEMLKKGAPYIISSISKLFTLILNSGKFPSMWNCSYIIPIHKAGSPNDPNNYRGIAVSSCLSKLYTMILNSRLTAFLKQNNLETDNQFGFKKNHRTTDSIYILRNLISKYVNSKLKKSGNYLFSCFIDFSKAFDSVWREGLLYKLLRLGVGEKFYNIVKSIYSNTKYCIKLNQGVTPYFDSHRGVKQGCNLSPSLFNVFVNGICDEVDNFDPADLNGIKFNCILYADDLLLISTSQEGLQKGIDAIEVYCHNWKLQVNIQKSKVIIFNGQGKNLNNKFQFYLNGSQLESVDSFNYLGIVFQCNGKFSAATQRLNNKAQKALFKMYKMLWDSNECYSVRLASKLFDSLVKPIILYGADIWGGFSINSFYGTAKFVSDGPDKDFETKLFNDKFVPEKLHVKFCKRVLGVHRKASNNACRGELGRYPLMVDICTSVIKFYQRLICKETCNTILDAAFDSSKSLKCDALYGFVQKLLQITEFTNSDVTHFRNFSEIFNKKLKQIYSMKWQKDTNKVNNNKLNTYKTFKNVFQFEPYLDKVKSKNSRVALTKFRISAHMLPVESGRYKGVSRENRLCNMCNSSDIGDEKHYFSHCDNVDNSIKRENFLKSLSIYAPNTQSIDTDEFFRQVFCSNDSFICNSVAHFVHSILEMF